MSPRDSDLVKLAGLCGWRLDVYERLFGGFPPGVRFLIPRTAPESSGVYSLPIPAPDAPLPEQMAFVGHLAVALAGPNRKSNTNVLIECLPGSDHYRVTFGGVFSSGDDLAWAAVRAAIAAKGGAT